MKQRRVLRWVVIGVVGLSLIPCGFFGFWFAAEFGSDSGSPSLAAEWRDRLNQYADPNSAHVADPKIVVVRFRNGEWVYGLSQNSHGIWYRGGGTLVVKDSKGRTRAFFGHVCGGGHIGHVVDLELLGLDEYYKRLESIFTEHPLK